MTRRNGGLTVVGTNLHARVGTDVESIDEVAASLARYGSRYAMRIFTEHEIHSVGGLRPTAAPGLTARFAAKEAVLKVLAPHDDVPQWRCIEVRSGINGAPSLLLSGTAARLAREQHIQDLAVSLSHGAGVGLATVVALVPDYDRTT